jgi:hypothetical protein
MNYRTVSAIIFVVATIAIAIAIVVLFVVRRSSKRYQVSPSPSTSPGPSPYIWPLLYTGPTPLTLSIKSDVEYNSLTKNKSHATANGTSVKIWQHGSSSAAMKKHGFNIKGSGPTPTGFTANNDWVMYGPFVDKTFIRNVYTYTLGNQIGLKSPTTTFFNVTFNGEEKGLFILIDKLKNKFLGADVTLAYDRVKGNPSFSDTWGQVLVVKDIAKGVSQSSVEQEIKDIQNKGDLSKIDLPSFANLLIIQEFSKNTDAYGLSNFLYRKNGKWYCSSWDYNLAYDNYILTKPTVDFYKNILPTIGSLSQGWVLSFHKETGGMRNWYTNLLKQKAFNDVLIDQWTKLVALNPQKILLSTIASLNKNAVETDCVIWNGTDDLTIVQYATQVLQKFVTARLEWMDKNIHTLEK